MHYKKNLDAVYIIKMPAFLQPIASRGITDYRSECQRTVELYRDSGSENDTKFREFLQNNAPQARELEKQKIMPFQPYFDTTCPKHQ